MLSQYLLPKFLFDIVRASSKHALGPLPRSEFFPCRVVSCRSGSVLIFRQWESTPGCYGSRAIIVLCTYIVILYPSWFCPFVGSSSDHRFNVLFNIIKIIYFGFTDFQRLLIVKIVILETSDIMTENRYHRHRVYVIRKIGIWMIHARFSDLVFCGQIIFCPLCVIGCNRGGKEQISHYYRLCR